MATPTKKKGTFNHFGLYDSLHKHQRILAVSKEHGCKGVPFVQYHRNCQSVFSMKRDLEKIKKSESKVRVLLGHTVLHNNPTVLHDVNT